MGFKPVPLIDNYIPNIPIVPRLSTPQIPKIPMFRKIIPKIPIVQKTIPTEYPYNLQTRKTVGQLKLNKVVFKEDSFFQLKRVSKSE